MHPTIPLEIHFTAFDSETVADKKKNKPTMYFEYALKKKVSKLLRIHIKNIK